MLDRLWIRLWVSTGFCSSEEPLTGGSSLARNQAAEVTAKVVAERLVAKLEQSGFVIMRKPIDTATPRRPEGWPHTPTR